MQLSKEQIMIRGSGKLSLYSKQRLLGLLFPLFLEHMLHLCIIRAE